MDKGIFIASLSTIFIGFSVVIASVASKSVHPVVLSSLAYAFSIIFLFIIIKLLGTSFQVKKLFSKFPKELFSIIILRSIIGQLLLLFGFSLTLAIRAVFLLRLEPVFVFVFSIILLKEKIRFRKIISLLILIFGAFLLATNGNINILEEIMIGDILVISALIFLAYSYIPAAKIMKNINAQTLTITSNLLALIIFIPIIFLFFQSNLIALSIDDSILILAYTLTFYVLGLVLWFRALKEAKPWIVASVLALSPIAGSILAFFWLDQFLLPIQLMGGIIMILATYFIGRESIKD